MSEVTNRSTVTNLKPLIKTPQFYWFLGHFSAIVFFFTYTISSFFTNNTSSLYNYAFNSIILTYLIVLRQSYQKRSILNLISNYPTLIRDDNIQYLSLLLLFRFSSKFPGPVSTALYPFIIFAIFHSLTYTKSFVVPNLNFLTNESKKHYINLISNFVVQYNERSLLLASSFELYLLVPVLLSLLKIVIFFEWLRSNPIRILKKLIVNFGVILFLKLRYDQSKQMKLLIQGYDLRLNQILYSNPYIPVQLQNLYQLIRQLIITYIGPIKIPQLAKTNVRKE